MKQLLLKLILGFVFVISAYSSQAQIEIEIEANGRSYSQIFDSLSTGLIPSRILYGTLYDRVYGWSGLDTWQSGDTTSVSRLFQSWYDAEQSLVNPLARPNNYDSMRTVAQQQMFQVKLPVVTINYQFGYINSTAESEGRMSVVDEILTDNNLASLYLTKCVAFESIDNEA